MTENLIDSLRTEAELDDHALSQLVRLPTWTARQAQQVLQAQARSGKSILRFAARHRFSPSRLYHWRKRLEAPACGAGVQGLPAPFVPVFISEPPVAQTPEPPDPADRSEPPCELQVLMPSGATVRVSRQAPESLVRCVLLALKEPAC